MDSTANRGYNVPEQWHDALNQNWHDIDADIDELFTLLS